MFLCPDHVRNNNIDWDFTIQALNYSIFDEPTSVRIQRYDSYKLKLLNHQLPTCDIMLRNYRALFNSSIQSISCSKFQDAPDSNTHLTTCSKILSDLKSILSSHRVALTRLLVSTQQIRSIYHQRY